MATTYAYVLVEYFLTGCQTAFVIREVTFNQQYAYDWQRGQAAEFTTREARAVPFITP